MFRGIWNFEIFDGLFQILRRVHDLVVDAELGSVEQLADGSGIGVDAFHGNCSALSSEIRCRDLLVKVLAT